MSRLAIIFVIIMMAILLLACSPANATTSNTQTTSSTIAGVPDKVEILYFHRTARWTTCICFEDGLTRVVSNYFQSEISSGKLTVGIYDTGDPKNAELVKKYNAVGPQLFFTTITNGVEKTKDIQEIWSWSCLTDKTKFDTNLKTTIEMTLQGLN